MPAFSFRLTLPYALFASLALIAVAGLGGAWLGFAEDVDSLGIQRSVEAIQAGGYERSRVMGVPLYELLAAALHSLGGVMLVNIASCVLMAAACGFLYAALREAGEDAAPYALLAAMSQPLVLINASAMMETALLTACVCAALWAAVSAAKERGWRFVWVAAIASALAVATRPDAALFALAVGCALAFEARAERIRAIKILAVFAICGLPALGLYGVMNGGFAFLGDVAVTQDETGRSISRAILGAVTIVSIPGAILLAILAVMAARAPQSALGRLFSAPAPARVLAWIAILSGGLYAARFLALPDELEYLLPATLALFAALGAFAPRLPLMALASVVMLSNILQIALFERTAEGVRFAGPSLQPGALVQDWLAREHNLWLRAPQTISVLADIAGTPDAQTDQTHLWLNGVAFQSGALAIGADQLYRFKATGAADDPHVLANYNVVVMCQQPLVLRRGWRVLQPQVRAQPDPAVLRSTCRPLPAPSQLG